MVIAAKEWAVQDFRENQPPGYWSAGLPGGFSADGVTFGGDKLWHLPPLKEGTMKILRIPAAAVVLVLGLGACGESTLLAPGEARYDNGSTLGTGHRTGAGVTTTTASDTPMTLTERNGSTLGTGH